MQGSNLDYKISSNEAFKDLAFQSSESGRNVGGESVSYYLYNRQWDGFAVAGASYDPAYNPNTDKIQGGENLYKTNTLGVDVEYDYSGTSVETIEADINIIKSQGVKSRGSGLQQLAGYEGLGKGAGAGGVHVIYEIRSTGFGPAEAEAVTASEFRVIP